MDTREISFLSSWWKVNSQLPVCMGVVVSRYKRANNDYKDL